MRGERLLSLTDAHAWMRDALGIRRDRATLFAWLYYGRGGVKLEAVSVAGKWHTSEGAIRRFLAACTKQHSDEAGCDVNPLAL